MSRPPKVIILGAGPCGLATALSLHLHASIPVSNIRILELRPVPSTIGGAVGLTPNALRYLDALGVLPLLREKSAKVDGIEIVSLRTGGKLGELSFRGPDGEGVGGYKGLRVKRGELTGVLLERWRSLGGDVAFGSKAVGFEELDDGIKVVCEDGREEVGDFLVGCDGIHSWVRSQVVQPERQPIYSGMMTCYGIVPVKEGSELKESLQSLGYESTCLFSSRRGSLLVSYCKPDRSEVYLAAVMETKEIDSREGWKTKGEDQEAIKRSLLDRFGGGVGVRKDLQVLIETVKDWYLYPVHKLPPKGQWSKGRVLLLGDAAHAMPPQGESVGLAIEDSILFASILAQWQPESPIEEIFARFERNRKKRIDDAFEDADWRWDTVKDSGLIGSLVKEWLTSAFLWWTKNSRDENYAFDVRDMELVD